MSLELPELRVANMRARRARILAAASARLAQGGYGALTLRELARDAEVTVPTIYNLIGAKEEVVVALVEQALDLLEAHLEDMPPMRGLARAEAVIAGSFTLFAGSTSKVFCSVFRCLQEMIAHSEKNTLGPMFSRAGKVYEQAILEASEAGMLRGDLLVLPLAHHILHGVTETFKLWGVHALPIADAEARAFYTLYTSFLADSTPGGREMLLAKLAPHEQQLNH